LEQSSGGLVSALASLSRNSEAGELYHNVVWVGKGDEDLHDDLQVDEVGTNFRLVPVAIETSLDQQFYGGFSNDLLWPLLHYFPSFAVFDERYFDGYVAANRLFADTIKPLTQPGDFIWVHDFHLWCGLHAAHLRNRILQPDLHSFAYHLEGVALRFRGGTIRLECEEDGQYRATGKGELLLPGQALEGVEDETVTILEVLRVPKRVSIGAPRAARSQKTNQRRGPCVRWRYRGKLGGRQE